MYVGEGGHKRQNISIYVWTKKKKKSKGEQVKLVEQATSYNKVGWSWERGKKKADLSTNQIAQIFLKGFPDKLTSISF